MWADCSDAQVDFPLERALSDLALETAASFNIVSTFQGLW